MSLSRKTCTVEAKTSVLISADRKKKSAFLGLTFSFNQGNLKQLIFIHKSRMDPLEYILLITRPGKRVLPYIRYIRMCALGECCLRGFVLTIGIDFSLRFNKRLQKIADFSLK